MTGYYTVNTVIKLGNDMSLSIYNESFSLHGKSACLVGTTVRRWTTVLEVVGSLPALAIERIKFLGLLRLPARVGQ